MAPRKMGYGRQRELEALAARLSPKEVQALRAKCEELEEEVQQLRATVLKGEKH